MTFGSWPESMGGMVGAVYRYGRQGVMQGERLSRKLEVQSST